MSQSPYTSSIRIGKWALRKLFNDERIAERGEQGELVVKITAQRAVPANKVQNWIPGTLSQELKYYDTQVISSLKHTGICDRTENLLRAGWSIRNG